MLLLSLLINAVYSQECERFSPNIPGLCCIFKGQGTGDIPNVPDDNVPDECVNSPVRIWEKDGICNENFDCCLCEEQIVNNCRNHNCGGDSSCIGNSMTLHGDPLGCTLICNGDSGCTRTKIVGSNMAGLGCDGDDSCSHSDIDLTCVNPGCLLKPNGDGSLLDSTVKITNAAGLFANGDSSCEAAKITFICNTNGLDKGCPIVLGGDSALENGQLSVQHATDIRCGGDAACKNTTMDITCVPAGCILNCGGDNACEMCDWEAENVKLIEFVGDSAFANSNITASCTLPLGCPVRCSAEAPCLKSNFDITNSNGLNCGGIRRSCEDSTFILRNNIKGLILCLGDRNCAGMTLNGGTDDVTGAVQPVEDVTTVTISGTNAGFNSDIFIECNEDLGCPVTCTQNGACVTSAPKRLIIYNVKTWICTGTAVVIATGQIDPACSGDIEIIPKDNMFALSCASAEACRDARFDIFLDDDINEILQINSGGEKGLQNAEINIDIPNLSDATITIRDILCGNALTCNLFQFIYNAPNTVLNFPKISCSGSGSCSDATYTITARIVTMSLRCENGGSCANLKLIINADTLNLDVIGCDNPTNAACVGATVTLNGETQPLSAY